MIGHKLSGRLTPALIFLLLVIDSVSGQSVGEEPRLDDDNIEEGSGDLHKMHVDDEDGIEGSGDDADHPLFTESSTQGGRLTSLQTSTLKPVDITEKPLVIITEGEKTSPPTSRPPLDPVVPIDDNEQAPNENPPTPDATPDKPSTTTAIEKFIRDLNTTTIIVIAAVVVILLILIIIVIVLLRRRCEARKRNQGKEYTPGNRA